jgi:hypothetical protein
LVPSEGAEKSRLDVSFMSNVPASEHPIKFWREVILAFTIIVFRYGRYSTFTKISIISSAPHAVCG